MRAILALLYHIRGNGWKGALLAWKWGGEGRGGGNMNVKFIEVGRDKRSWEAECNGELTYEWLYRQAKKALRSSDIDFSEDGAIFAGFRNVGRFEVANEK